MLCIVTSILIPNLFNKIIAFSDFKIVFGLKPKTQCTDCIKPNCQMYVMSHNVSCTTVTVCTQDVVGQILSFFRPEFGVQNQSISISYLLTLNQILTAKIISCLAINYISPNFSFPTVNCDKFAPGGLKFSIIFYFHNNFLLT